MSEKPILFSAPMVKAILAGTKVVTRRVVGLPHLKRSETRGYDWTWRGQAPIRSVAQQVRHPMGCWQDVRDADLVRLCPYGGAGDSLWVREAWAAWFRDDVAGQFDWKGTAKADRTEKNCTGIAYRATLGDSLSIDRWVTPLFMPRWASRITLDAVNVRVERLHDITAEDAAREGVAHWWDSLTEVESRPVGNLWTELAIAHGWEKTAPDYRGLFGALWCKINGRESWASNPFVWRVEFRRGEQR